MVNNKMKVYILAGVFIILVVGFVQFFLPSSVVSPASPIATSTPTQLGSETASTTAGNTENTQKKKATFSLQLADGDSVASWNFIGAYAGNDAFVQKANSDIVRLTALLGTGTYTDYTLYVSIANQYDLLGDGKNELAYLEKALAIDSTNTGLAWHNAGQLLARLGAYATARTAFERAVVAEPIGQYKLALADFLEAHFPLDMVAK
ncbi:hypothetical protein CO131_01360 [Candidatus Kaiserbacteria bacterium CG_4_9_14_3_um_filter_50_16]|nr:MAG: hypothetical protein COZ83_01875 [Candidatus Kaiserbacteria bacterium CG_4_8_14_3_um_filter_50_23]PJA94451.1 MAG: hypothetical protein CO131_01360 [Candidatus Kaiserbacteria bacterium CG_4_9_14_3_um_filter_50_16]